MRILLHMFLKKYQLLISLFFSIFVVSFFSFYINKFELAPGMVGETIDVYAKNSANQRIHAINLDEQTLDDILKSLDVKKQNVFHIGNSQSQSVNQLKDGQTNLIGITSNLIEEKYNFFAHTMPNMGLMEYWLVLNYWNSKVKLDYLVVPVFFDDMRESEIRSDFISKIIEDNFQIPFNDTISQKINLNVSSEFSEIDTENEMFGKTVERHLNNLLSDNIFFWDIRVRMKQLVYVSLYNLRNTIFNIKPTSKRKMLKSAYINNIKTLNLIIRYCHFNNIKLHIYIPPIRNDYEIPYDLEEYGLFKSFLKNICNKEGVGFSNFENIIPNQFWGLKNSTNINSDLELDFMHFQYDGHKILSDSIAKKILNIGL